MTIRKLTIRQLTIRQLTFRQLSLATVYQTSNKHLRQMSQTNISDKCLRQISQTNVSDKCLRQMSITNVYHKCLSDNHNCLSDNLDVCHSFSKKHANHHHMFPLEYLFLATFFVVHCVFCFVFCPSSLMPSGAGAPTKGAIVACVDCHVSSQAYHHHLGRDSHPCHPGW